MPSVRSLARGKACAELRRSGPRVALLVLLVTLVAGVVPAAALTKASVAPPQGSVAGTPVPGPGQPSQPPLPASASWGGYEIGTPCLRPGYTACLQVEVEGRAVLTSATPSAPAGYDSTSGWARVTADDSGAVARVQIDKIVLGTQYGILTQSGASAGADRPAVATLEGPSHAWGRYCATQYHVAAYWSARLSDGSLRTGKLLGPWYSAPSC